MYQQVNLSDNILIGAPGPLPSNLIGLPDRAVADISAVCDPPPPGMEGRGWWPVIIAAPASFDPTNQVAVDPASLAADPATTTVRGQQTARAMTADEFLTANPVPPSISRRQFYQQLAVEGTITQDEALAAIGSGVIPPELMALVQKLSADQQFGAKCLLAGAGSFERQHQLTQTLAALLPWTSVQTDAFWRAAFAL